MLSALVSSLRQFGLFCTMGHYALRVVNTFTFFKVYEVMLFEHPLPQWTMLDSRQQSRFLDLQEVLECCREKDLDLNEAFVHYAFHKGDQCYAVFDGQRLASYGWYSTRPTKIGACLQLSFAPGYAYVYHGYTRPEYRGRRVQAVRATLALIEQQRQGAKGVLSYIEADNFSAIRAAKRFNTRRIGRVIVIKLFGAYRIFHTRTCSDFGVQVTVVKDARQGETT